MTELILIGTTHFSGRDDVFTAKMQKDISSFSDLLVSFHPTKIAVELPLRNQELLDSFYSDFDDSAFTTKTSLGSMVVYGQAVTCSSENEIVQLGFRTAKKLGHQKIFAVDEDILMSDELMAKIQPYISIGSNLDRLNALEATANTLEEQYRVWNSREYILTDHNMYIAANKANLGDYEGVRLLLSWYERNLKIYSNIQNLLEDGDRILLIIGSGHLKLLSELADADENINLIKWA